MPFELENAIRYCSSSRERVDDVWLNAGIERRWLVLEASAPSVEEAQEYVNLSQKRKKKARSRIAKDANAPIRSEQAVPPNIFVCPITQELMQDPVIAMDGHTYEKTAIVRWFDRKLSSPKTGCVLEMAILIPNHAMRHQIIEWREAHHRRSTSCWRRGTRILRRI